MFCCIDDYTADPVLRARTGGVDEAEMRAKAEEVYGRLEALSFR